MRLVGAGLGRRAVADRGLAGDQRRLVGFLRAGDRGRDRLPGPGRRSVRPAQPADLKRFTWSTKSEMRGRPVDRNAVVVIEHDQLVELPVARPARSLPARCLPSGRRRRRAHRYDDRRSSCRIRRPASSPPAPCRPTVARPWPSGPVVVSMPLVWKFSGWPGVSDPSWRKCLIWSSVMSLVAGEIEQRVEQHRAVAGRQHEAVAVRPVRVGGVEFQELREQHGGDIGGAHRQAGMAGFRLFDRVHREPADRIGHTGVIDLRHDENPSEMRCLLAIRRAVKRAWRSEAEGGNWNSGLDSICIPEVQGK